MAKLIDITRLGVFWGKVKEYFLTDGKIKAEFLPELDLSLYKVVTELPTEDIDEEKIYLVRNEQNESGNLYTEYLYTDGAWEKIGELHYDAATRSYVDEKVLTPVAYDNSLNLNNLVQDGVYKITGTRTNAADNMPIDNTGGYVSGRLVVTRGDNGGVAMVSQVLTLNNFAGHDARTFTRCFRNDDDQWRPWEELQGMNLVGQVSFADMWQYVDNGMYSGVFAGVNGKANSAITGVMITVNNYAVATAMGTQKYVTQYLMGVDVDGTGTGVLMRTYANDGTASTTPFAAKTLTSADIADGSVTTGKLASKAVTAAKIADSTITATQLANKTVTAAKIADATVTATQLANKTVTAAKMADATITEDKMATTAFASESDIAGLFD